MTALTLRDIAEKARGYAEHLGSEEGALSALRIIAQNLSALASEEDAGARCQTCGHEHEEYVAVMGRFDCEVCGTHPCKPAPAPAAPTREEDAGARVMKSALRDAHAYIEGRAAYDEKHGHPQAAQLARQTIATGQRALAEGRWPPSMAPAAPTTTRCTCGSGAHPRECALHPARFAEHIAELNAENDADLAAAPTTTGTETVCDECGCDPGQGVVFRAFQKPQEIPCPKCSAPAPEDGCAFLDPYGNPCERPDGHGGEIHSGTSADGKHRWWWTPAGSTADGLCPKCGADIGNELAIAYDAGRESVADDCDGEDAQAPGEAGHDDARASALEDAAKVVEALAAHTSREDEEQAAWIHAWKRAADAIRALPAPCSCGGRKDVPHRTQRNHTRTRCWDVNVDTHAVMFLPAARTTRGSRAEDHAPGCNALLHDKLGCTCGALAPAPAPSTETAPAPAAPSTTGTELTVKDWHDAAGDGLANPKGDHS